MFSRSVSKIVLLFFFMFFMLFMIGSVFASWNYVDSLVVEPVDDTVHINLGIFDYVETPGEVPKGEVTLIERLYAILNNKYSTDIVTNSRDYLINETIQVRWEPGADPYVGSMDLDYEFQINELFGDVVMEEHVSFILKNQDLNWDGYNEIALYSTSDPLDCVEEYDGVVCVYVTVFSPVVDAQKNIIGYEYVCESLRGYCSEVYYNWENRMPSFSTDEWRDDIGYWHHDGNKYVIPEDAMSVDGSKPFRYDYNSYTREYSYEGCPWPGRTLPLGLRTYELLWDKIPWIG